ncbi:MAG: TonB-dependent receptor [Thermomonas hydrothermalis]|uniref:TonB-dependent receptor n=1 Tax=Thermomonas hydrothermalis TaxID=213588 RepID=UPI0023544D85|nr:TonB-dependent receptor [Thermomonas hydrothermalis]MCL6618328.1 TonB-dependent receptor [Thermomonas hydrothermalis]
MSCQHLHSNRLATAVAVALLWSGALPAVAQTAPAAGSAGEQAQNEPKTLDTLVVTAQKREEIMQNVPITVTALPQQLLQDNNVRDIKDLQTLVPGLTVTSTQNEAITTARLRGIGTVGDNIGLESSVGIVIDDVYRPRNSVGFGDLGELDRIEVLKGPQGTLFGKNTSAGVISIITRKPDFEWAGGGELGIGNYNARGANAWLNAPMSDRTALRLYAAHRERDGWMRVVTGAGPRSEHRDYDQNYDTFRAKLLWLATDNVEVLLAADATHRNENCCTAVQLVSGSSAPLINALGGGNAIAIPANPWARVAYSNRDTTQKIDDKGVQATVTVSMDALGGATLTSVTASRDWSAINGRDFDFSAADLIYMNPQKDESYNQFRTFSQELRLAGSTEHVDWLVGAFYSHETIRRTESYRIGAAYEPYLSIGLLSLINPPSASLPNAASFLADATGRPFGAVFAGLGALDHYRQTARSSALFSNNTWHASEGLDVTLGLRYTRETKDLRSQYANPNGGLGCASYFDPNGTISAAAIGRIATALTARGVPFSLLPAATQQSIISNVVAYSCLPWANVLHNGRVTNQSMAENEWSGTLKAAYRWNPHVMTYLSYARGYKAGGFNLDRVQSANGLSSGGPGIRPVNDTSFPGEFVNSWELEAKTTWAGGNLLLNGALFHQRYSDFQLNSFLGTSFVVRSIPEVVSRGLDAELLWQPKSLRGLMLQAGAMWADTRYGKHIPGADFVYPGALYKLPGARISFAPAFSGTLSLTYQWDIGATLRGRFNIGGKYMTGYNTGSDLDAEKWQKGYGLVNARIGLGRRDERWQVELWATNLFNQRYLQVGFDGPLQALGTPEPGNPRNTYDAFLGAPRMFGATLRLRFE